MSRLNSIKCCVYILVCLLSFSLANAETEKNVPAKGTVVMKILALNPLKDQPQALFLKAYLPKEAKTEDVIDTDGLEITYDQEQGAYYVYKKVEIPPAGMIRKKIIIKDIWLISEEELNSIGNKTVELYKLLTDIDHISQGNLLRERIEDSIAKIKDKQIRFLDAEPGDHIKAYRENKKLLESIENDKISLETTVISNQRKEEEKTAKAAAEKRTAMMVMLLLILIAVSVTGSMWWFRALQQKKSAAIQDLTYDFKFSPNNEASQPNIETTLKPETEKPKPTIEERLKNPQQPSQE